MMAATLLGSAALLPQTTAIPLSSLLSTCVDASLRGCAEIRRVHFQRAATGSMAVSLKETDDPKSALTEADLAAQAAIMGALHAAWPGLRIVGEEGDDVPLTDPGAPLRRDLCPAATSEQTARLSDITVFVDPLDGTREFVEGRLSNVLSLVGFSVHGRAVGGAIGIPFSAGDADGAAAVVYSLEGAGFGTHGFRPVAAALGAGLRRPLVTTGDSSNAVLSAARAAALASGGSPVVIGGAGAKLLATAEGRADLAVTNPKPNTSHVPSP